MLGHRQRFATLAVPERDPLAELELHARRDAAVVRRRDAGRDHREAVKQNVERLTVAEFRQRRPRPIFLFALRQIDIRRRLRNRPHRQLNVRIEAGQRAG